MDGRMLDGRELRVQMARYGRPSSPTRRNSASSRRGAGLGAGAGGGAGGRRRSRSRSPIRRRGSRSPRRRTSYSPRSRSRSAGGSHSPERRGKFSRSPDDTRNGIGAVGAGGSRSRSRS